MSEQSIGGPPRAFLIISIVALLWNVVGVMIYVMHIMTSPEALASMPAAERALMESEPAWATAAYTIAVFGGVFACVGLLLKKAWSVPLFLVSLVAIIVLYTYWFFMAASLEVYGMAGLIVPVLVTVIAVFLVWYSRDARGKGWLS